MAPTEAMKRAIKKYNDEKIDRITLRVEKGKREAIQDHVSNTGESVNSFINRAIDEAIERDNAQK